MLKNFSSMSIRNTRRKRVADETIEEIEPKKKTLSSKVSKLKPQTENEILPNSNEDEKSYWLMKSEPESRIENGHEMKFGFDDGESDVRSTISTP